MSGPCGWAANGSGKKNAALISLGATRLSDPRGGNTPAGRSLMALSLRGPPYVLMTDRQKSFG